MNNPISCRAALVLMAGAAAAYSVVGRAGSLLNGFQTDTTSTDSFDWFLPALKDFLGTSTGGYISRDELIALGYNPKPASDGQLYLYDQFAGFFFSPPELRISMPSGNRLLESSWPHYAVRRATVITEGNSTRILAAALLTYATPISKDDKQRSSIVFERPGLLLSEAVVNELHQFLQWEVRQEGRLYGQHLVKVESSINLYVIRMPLSLGREFLRMPIFPDVRARSASRGL